MVFGTLDYSLISEIEQTGWTTELETGIDVLDGQHRKYFDLVNGFLNAAKEVNPSDSPHSKLVKKLDFLIQYAMEHFSTEQELMKEKSYQHYEQHLKEHMYFLQNVGSIRKQVDGYGYSEKLERETHFYILDWFVSHILSSDRKFVEFLNQDSAKSGNSLDEEIPG